MINESRNQLREAIRNYIQASWHYSNLGDDQLERYLAGCMALIAVEMWEKPFTPMVPPVIIEEQERRSKMNILTVCDQGNNRSVQFAHLLKYKYPGSDVIPAGLNLSKYTLEMLFKWADIIILTANDQKIPAEYDNKIKIWNVGEDKYPRPFNPELNQLARKLIEDNPL